MKRIIAWLGIGIVCVFAGRTYAGPKPAPVLVVLWFDTEDYLLPASDDAALRLADFLTRENIKATFKVVGEKARTLERRGRGDVIARLKKHEIGYHSNFHSTQPSPAMYLNQLGWDEGVAEFDRRERVGLDDVARIFGQTPTCYGQPGSSWGPQVYGAMKKWGMEVYLDGGAHINLDDKPCYYCGILTLYKLAYLMRANVNGQDLRQAEERFQDARLHLIAEGGGVVSIMYHPCEFVHKQFWDGVNFRAGANPPREKWQLPPAKSPAESRIAFDTFENYIRFIKRFPEVRFITASAATRFYRDKAKGKTFTASELRAVAAAATDPLGYQRNENYALTPAEVFALVNDYLVAAAAGRSPLPLKLAASPLGPGNPPVPMTAAVSTDWSQLTRTAADVADYVRRHGRIPNAVWLGSVPVPPEAYAVALAGVVKDLLDGKPAPAAVTIRPARLGAGRYVADDATTLWRWVIFPKGFRAPALMEQARLQAWTLKPALLDATNR